jgi:hypothetical protein
MQAENVINFMAEMIAVFFLENDYKLISHYLLGYLVEVSNCKMGGGLGVGLHRAVTVRCACAWTVF